MSLAQKIIDTHPDISILNFSKIEKVKGFDYEIRLFNHTLGESAVIASEDDWQEYEDKI